MSSDRYSFLILEDSPPDAALAQQRLMDAGIDFVATVVDSRAGFISAFETHPYDLILADYSLPDFDGLTALRMVRARYGRLPFIFVSGVLGEEIAVESMVSGATDYVLKTRLERIVPSVQRALTEHEDFLLRQTAESRLREAEEATKANSERQALLLALLQQQRGASSEEEFIATASEKVAEYIGVDRAGFYEVIDGDTLQYLWQSSRKGFSADALLALERFDPKRSEGYRRGQPSAVADVLEVENSNGSEMAAAGLRSFIGTPILRANTWRAGFFVADTHPRIWNDAEVQFVCEVAEVTWDSVERTRAVAALATSEQRLRTAAETANLGSWSLDLVSGRMICSDQCKRNYGQPLDRDFNYSDLRATIHPDDLAPMAEAVERTIAGHETYRAEYRTIWPDNTTHWVIAAGRASYDDAGVPVSMTGFTLDVTDRHKSQEALLQSEKLVAVGRLASSIAHEINNPLESVTNLLYIANHADDIDVIKEQLALADLELRRVAAITSQTLRFHRQSSGPKQVTSGDLFDSALSVFERRLDNNQIHVTTELQSKRSIRCLDGEIRQVLVNLVSNAIDALPPDGRLLGRSRDGRRGGVDGVWLTVADNGAGMSLVSQQKAFEAFYSTKGIHGTGLGLWVSHEIVKRHAGLLKLRSSDSPHCHGTVIYMFLPCDGLLDGGK